MKRLRFIVFFFLILILITSCNLITTNGNQGYNGSILQSKKIGAFITQFQPKNNHYKINDSTYLNIKSAWMEYSWKYTGLFSEKAEIDTNFIHLIIKTDKNGLNDCFDKFLISANDDGKYFACASGEALIGTFRIMPKDSIISCKIENRLIDSNSSSRPIIGYLEFEKIINK